MESKMENQEVSIKLPLRQWNVILAALVKRPFEEVVDLVGEVRRQAEIQITQVQAAAQPQDKSEV